MSFIVIEGDNGTGKDTQALKLSEKLGHRIITNFEDMKLLNKKAKEYQGKERVKKFLEYCNQSNKYANKIENTIVVRYWVSTLAAAYADNIFTYEEILKLQEKYCAQMKQPDIVICLWCDYKKRVDRIIERNSPDFDDITQNRSIKYAWILKELKEIFKLNWVDIDTTGKSIEEVFEEILNNINKEEVKKLTYKRDGKNE